MLNSINDDQFTSQVAGILKSFNDAPPPRKYYDYRQSVKDIIDNLGPNVINKKGITENKQRG